MACFVMDFDHFTLLRNSCFQQQQNLGPGWLESSAIQHVHVLFFVSYLFWTFGVDDWDDWASNKFIFQIGLQDMY